MDLYQTIRNYSRQPLTHQLLMDFLKDYKRPNDKVHGLLKEGVLSPVKKGLYIAGPAVKAGKPEPFLLANHILGPSYVSLDTALFHYGLIPERVYEISSMTTKTARKFVTDTGIFSYIRLKLPYYSFGIRSHKLADDQYAMVASPEKALLDKIITTSGVVFRSQKEVLPYLLENLRMDENGLKEFDWKTMQEWLTAAPKKESLIMVIKAIHSL